MTFQFALSIIMIVTMLVNVRQLQFVRSSDLGFVKEQVIIVQTPAANELPEIAKARNSFKERLLRNQDVEKVAYSSGGPSLEEHTSPVFEIDGEKRSWKYMDGDEDFIETLGLSIIQGRGFSASKPGDQCDWTSQLRVGGMIFNETAIKELDIKDPIGK